MHRRLLINAGRNFLWYIPIGNISKYVQIMSILITDMSGGLVLKCAWCEFTVQLTKDMCTNNELASKNLNEHVLEYRCKFVKGKCC